MNFRKLNEELEKWLKLNEISTELKQRYITGRQKQIDDLQNKLRDPNFKSEIEATKQSYDRKIDRLNKRKFHKSAPIKVGQITDTLPIEVQQIIYPDDSPIYVQCEYNRSLRWWEDTRNVDISNVIGNICYKTLTNLIKYEEITSPEELNIKLDSKSLENLKKEIHYSYGDWTQKPYLYREFLSYIDELQPSSEYEDVINDVNMDLSESYQLNELSLKTTRNWDRKIRDQLQVDQVKLNEPKEIRNRINRLKQSVKDAEDNIKGKDIADRNRRRRAWIVDIFSEIEDKVDQLQQEHSDFKIEFNKSLQKNECEIVISRPINEQGEIFQVLQLNNFRLLEDESYKYKFNFQYMDKIKSSHISDEFKKFWRKEDIFRKSETLQSSGVENIGEIVYDFLNGYLTKTDEFINTQLPELYNKLDKVKNRAPIQWTEEIELFGEKSQWGLDIQLRVMKRGYQVVSHVGGWSQGEYDPNELTTVLSGVSRDWRKAIEQAAEKCTDPEDSIIDSLLMLPEQFADNEYADYFHTCLEELDVSNEGE